MTTYKKLMKQTMSALLSFPNSFKLYKKLLNANLLCFSLPSSLARPVWPLRVNKAERRWRALDSLHSTPILHDHSPYTGRCVCHGAVHSAKIEKGKILKCALTFFPPHSHYRLWDDGRDNMDQICKSFLNQHKYWDLTNNSNNGKLLAQICLVISFRVFNRTKKLMTGFLFLYMYIYAMYIENRGIFTCTCVISSQCKHTYWITVIQL